MPVKKRIKQLISSLVMAVLLIALITSSAIDPADSLEQIRAFSRIYEFDYVSWTAAALIRKLGQSSINADDYISVQDQRELVLEYLSLRSQVSQLQNELSSLIANPDQGDRAAKEASLREDLELSASRRKDLAPFVESVIQDQLNHALRELDMSLGGFLTPGTLYRSEPNSFALIISPRDEIRQEANLMLVRGMSLDEIVQLETSIEEDLDLSALVVGIGGLGLYPSMIIETGNLDWLLEVVSHEWTHNYLTLRPLGMAYGSSAEIRTINETIADLSADEIQLKTFELYYPEYLPQEVPAIEPGESAGNQPQLPPDPETFDFREQMHITRLEVDRLLEKGEIDQAEAYMESRRSFFWENGYQIRRLNQAYFAFHGSYAADPGGAASEEGVDLGAELRALKGRSASYRDFMKLVAWRWRLDQFEDLFKSRTD